ncbi:7a00798a-c158-45ed-b225-1a74973ae1eb [Sclerotinia trifoliorum]|uniref:7a00798a-c158-45ed-b225-1a74973ae1eb n=1 Tax=Sclerotinia trifoliorum TaxID=28548 RepID=A0A8H2VT15_9HELO|nr:7a00798a-c158-45ed-b225-1a74973ae1eb [Sclerotinia trifoliorum]
MSTRNQMPTFNSFTITQPFLGAPLQFQPALGSRELEDLIDAYVVGKACKQDKLSTVTIDFYNHATVDINTGSLVRRYDVMPWAYDQSPSQSQSSGLSPPIFTPSPTSSATFADSTYSSMSTPSNRTRGSRVTKKTKKETTKKSAEVRLPGFSIMTKDGIDVTNSAGRGTKTKEQREHAHLMRIIKACDECKRKKIRCDPSHRRSSRTDMSRASASIRPSPPSQSNPSPAASTPSLSRETTKGSEQSSPPVDSFTMEDFVLFPEDDLNQWNPEMSIPGFDTQYSDFSMTNYDSFPDFDTSFSTMNDNLSFDFPSFDQSSSFSPQSLSNTNNFSNYYNTQPSAHSDVNSQYISSTQPQSDLDFFESFGDLQHFSPTHSQQAHPQAVPDEDPGKMNSFAHAPASRSRVNNSPSISPTTIPQTDGGASLQDFTTSFSFSPTDSCYQSQGSEYGFVNSGLEDPYGNVPGSGVDSAFEQSPQSGSSDCGLENVSSIKERSRSQRTKRQVILDRERSRIDDHERQLVNAFSSSMGESHVPRASAEQLVSSPGVINSGDGLPMNIATSRGLESSCSPVPGETPWSFESTLSSLTKSRSDTPQDPAKSNTGDDTLPVVKPQEHADAHASSNNSTVIDTSNSLATQVVGNYVQSRRANFATSSSDRQVLGVNTNIVSTHVAVSSSMSSPRSKPIVESMAQALAGIIATGALVVPDRVKVMTSPRFSLVDKLNTKASSNSTEKVSSSSLDNYGNETIVSKGKNTSAVPSAGPSLNVNIPGYSTLVKNSTEAVTAPATTTLCNVSTFAALALCLAAAIVVSRCLESSAMALVVYLVASVCCGSSCTVSRPEKSFMSTFISASTWNSWSDMKQKIDCENQRSLKGKNPGSLDVVGKMIKKFSSVVSI